MLGSRKVNTRATSLALTRALRFAKSKVIPSLSCSGKDGLSVVHLSFVKGLTGVEREGDVFQSLHKPMSEPRLKPDSCNPRLHALWLTASLSMCKVFIKTTKS